MCGIIGAVTSHQARLSIDDRTLCRMRDRLTHRGPDGAGFWRNDHIMFGHRRLAIIDPHHGEQPFVLRDSNGDVDLVLTYNGELYNHRELRRELERTGWTFTTQCDTETVACALRQWGVDESLRRFRGMFAFGLYEPKSQRLTLARDALGIKPLYWTRIDTPRGHELCFASEPIALLDHPHCRREPDWPIVSAYLSTIRTTLGSRTMYRDIRTVEPGEMVQFNLRNVALRARSRIWWSPPAPIEMLSENLESDATRSVVCDSVASHLMNDGPTACLLSGGLDSAIITSIANEHVDGLRTFCATSADSGGEQDRTAAAQLAELLETQHQETNVSRDDFAELWPWMIEQTGLPLSTPNEVGIYLLAQSIQPHARVALSGEGADEWFGGYKPILRATEQHLAALGDREETIADASAFYLQTTSWISIHQKHSVLTSAAFEGVADDDALLRQVTGDFQRFTSGHSAVDRHNAVQRHVNLTGLLRRLDSAMMLGSVEGRTPFADLLVAEHAAETPISTHALLQSGSSSLRPTGTDGNAYAFPTTPSEFTTKRLLRSAFRHKVPTSILQRPKQSFPLPFQTWLSDQCATAFSCSSSRDVFQPTVLSQIAANPHENWRSAWPIMNVCLWLRSVWD